MYTNDINIQYTKNDNTNDNHLWVSEEAPAECYIL